ncbi:MAG: PQQ-dependent sugar dehydrogenase [Actinomycetia bacterium]|nr:PQQ-dependent sugar dehydrogenase [Actinomycetes bacterium]
MRNLPAARTRPQRRIVVATSALVLAAGLTACGDDDPAPQEPGAASLTEIDQPTPQSPTDTEAASDGGTTEATGEATDEESADDTAQEAEAQEPSELPEPAEVAVFDAPWAMTFLPDGQLLVTEKGGHLQLLDPESGEMTLVEGAPEVVDAGQGGLGDVVIAPDFDSTRAVYLSWVESGTGGTGAVVGTGQLSEDGTSLDGLEVIWRQEPKTSGNGHFSHKMAFSPDGQHLFVTSGDRQALDPAQDRSNTLGSIVRLNPDGTPAEGNPFADEGGVTGEIWSYGHRNPLGIAFDAEGNLWSTEMGPQHGDELNLIVEGANYGWPVASMGEHYSGENIPDHADDDGFEPPKEHWIPAISPANLMIYDGAMFPDWQGSAFVGGLSGQTLVRVALEGTSAEEVERWDLGERIREVEQGPNGSIWLLEDGDGARLLRFSR